MAQVRYQSQTQQGVQVDQGLRSYMLGVYNYMALGIAATAMIVMLGVVSPAIGDTMRVLALPAMLGVLGLGFFGYKLILNSRSVTTAHAAYWAYVALWGVGIAPMVHRYLGINPSIVMTAFLSAAVTFGAMSLWGYTSKKDLTRMGGMAAMALLGLLVVGIVNMVVAMFTGFGGTTLMISLLVSAGFVIFVSLITAWETQMIKEMYYDGDAGEVATRKSIFGAFALYGSFISIFANLLQLLGFMSSDE
jgi:uncharacterized protein